MRPAELFGLAGRTALVTGSSRGIGRAIAETLAGAGARLMLHGAKASAPLDAASQSVRQNGGDASTLIADLESADACRSLAEAAIRSGPVDILVLNASVEVRTDLAGVTEADFDRQMNVNLRSTFLLAQALVPPMAARGWGRVLLVGSIQETRPNPRMAVYAASKAAQTNFALTLSRSHASSGVTVNVIRPGAIRTDRNEEVLSDLGYSRKVLEQIPARRIGVPLDCAGAALLLCGDAGAYINGAIIPIDGGWSIG